MKLQYIKALQADGIIREGNLRLLGILFDAPGCRATSEQIASVLGYSDFRPINALIGNLGKRVANYLNLELPDRPSNSPGWWQIIMDYEKIENQIYWKLKPDLFDALVELDMVLELENALFPETALPRDLKEGAVKKIQVNGYERNQTARLLCIKHYGCHCAICGFDFEKVYGDRGRGFIHVHHIDPISSTVGEYTINPIKDLIPLCPNCHAMIHTSPQTSVDELKKIIVEGSSYNSGQSIRD